MLPSAAAVVLLLFLLCVVLCGVFLIFYVAIVENNGCIYRVYYTRYLRFVKVSHTWYAPGIIYTTPSVGAITTSCDRSVPVFSRFVRDSPCAAAKKESGFFCIVRRK